LNCFSCAMGLPVGIYYALSRVGELYVGKKKMKFTILVHKGPDEAVVSSVIKIAKTARAKGHEVNIFAMAVGVMNLARDDFTALIGDGVNITVCGHNRSQYMAPDNIEGVKYGSQYDLAVYTQDCDRFISFN